jgi:hypothetical protein
MARSKINWIAVMTAYVVKGWSAQKCADEFSIDVTTIKKRASAEGWTAQRNRNTTHATEAATEEATQIVATAALHIRSEHAKAVSQLNALLAGASEDVSACKPGRSRAETRRACFESFKIAVGLQRTVLGITEGQSSLADGEDDGTRRIQFIGANDEVESA